MSRSYKKTPVYKDLVKGSKNRANRKVRHNKDFNVNGGAYKRIYNQYDISDFHFRDTLADYLHWHSQLRHVHDAEVLTPEQVQEVTREWYKYYHRK